MRTVKRSLLALAGLLAIAAGSSALAAPKLEPSPRLVTIIFVVVCGLFLAGCVWRLSHADRARGED